MSKDKEIGTCVQCQRGLTHYIEVITGDGSTRVVNICIHPNCANYGILAICQENMPKEQQHDQ